MQRIKVQKARGRSDPRPAYLVAPPQPMDPRDLDAVRARSSDRGLQKTNDGGKI